MGRLIYGCGGQIIAEEETSNSDMKRTLFAMRMVDEAMKKEEQYNKTHICPKCNMVMPVLGCDCENC